MKTGVYKVQQQQPVAASGVKFAAEMQLLFPNTLSEHSSSGHLDSKLSFPNNSSTLKIKDTGSGKLPFEYVHNEKFHDVSTQGLRKGMSLIEQKKLRSLKRNSTVLSSSNSGSQTSIHDLQKHTLQHLSSVPLSDKSSGDSGSRFSSFGANVVLGLPSLSSIKYSSSGTIGGAIWQRLKRKSESDLRFSENDMGGTFSYGEFECFSSNADKNEENGGDSHYLDDSDVFYDTKNTGPRKYPLEEGSRHEKKKRPISNPHVLQYLENFHRQRQEQLEQEEILRKIQNGELIFDSQDKCYNNDIYSKSESEAPFSVTRLEDKVLQQNEIQYRNVDMKLTTKSNVSASMKGSISPNGIGNNATSLNSSIYGDTMSCLSASSGYSSSSNSSNCGSLRSNSNSSLNRRILPYSPTIASRNEFERRENSNGSVPSKISMTPNYKSKNPNCFTSDGNGFEPNSMDYQIDRVVHSDHLLQCHSKETHFSPDPAVHHNFHTSHKETNQICRHDTSQEEFALRDNLQTNNSHTDNFPRKDSYIHAKNMSDIGSELPCLLANPEARLPFKNNLVRKKSSITAKRFRGVDPVFFDEELEDQNAILIPPLEEGRASLEEIVSQEKSIQSDGCPLRSQERDGIRECIDRQCSCERNSRTQMVVSKTSSTLIPNSIPGNNGEITNQPSSSNAIVQALNPAYAQPPTADSININLIGSSASGHGSGSAPQINITLPAGMFYDKPKKVNDQQKGGVERTESNFHHAGCNSANLKELISSQNQLFSDSELCGRNTANNFLPISYAEKDQGHHHSTCSAPFNEVARYSSLNRNSSFSLESGNCNYNSKFADSRGTPSIYMHPCTGTDHRSIGSRDIVTTRSDVFGEVILDRHFDPVACQHFFRTRLSKTRILRNTHCHDSGLLEMKRSTAINRENSSCATADLEAKSYAGSNPDFSPNASSNRCTTLGVPAKFTVESSRYNHSLNGPICSESNIYEPLPKGQNCDANFIDARDRENNNTSFIDAKNSSCVNCFNHTQDNEGSEGRSSSIGSPVTNKYNNGVISGDRAYINDSVQQSTITEKCDALNSDKNCRCESLTSGAHIPGSSPCGSLEVKGSMKTAALSKDCCSNHSLEHRARDHIACPYNGIPASNTNSSTDTYDAGKEVPGSEETRVIENIVRDQNDTHLNSTSVIKVENGDSRSLFRADLQTSGKASALNDDAADHKPVTTVHEFTYRVGRTGRRKLLEEMDESTDALTVKMVVLKKEMTELVAVDSELYNQLTNIQRRIGTMSDQLKMLSAIVDGDTETFVPEPEVDNPSQAGDIKSNFTQEPIQHQEVRDVEHEGVERYLVSESNVAPHVDPGIQPQFHQGTTPNQAIRMQDQNNNNSVRFDSEVKCFTAVNPNHQYPQHLPDERVFECVKSVQSCSITNQGVQKIAEVSNKSEESFCRNSQEFSSENSAQEGSDKDINNTGSHIPFHLNSAGAQRDGKLQNLALEQLFQGSSRSSMLSNGNLDLERGKHCDPKLNFPIPSPHFSSKKQNLRPAHAPMYSLSLNVNTTSVPRTPLASASSEEGELYSDADIDEVVDKDSLDGDQVRDRDPGESTSSHQQTIDETTQQRIETLDKSNSCLPNITAISQVKAYPTIEPRETSEFQQDILQPPEQFASPLSSPSFIPQGEQVSTNSFVSQTPSSLEVALPHSPPHATTTQEFVTQFHTKEELALLKSSANVEPATVACLTPPSPNPSLAPPPLPTSPPPLLDSGGNEIIEILSVLTKPSSNTFPEEIVSKTEVFDEKESLDFEDRRVNSLLTEKCAKTNFQPSIRTIEIKDYLLPDDAEKLHARDESGLGKFNSKTDFCASKLIKGRQETSKLPSPTKSATFKLPTKVQNEARVMKMTPKKRNNSASVQKNLASEKIGAEQEQKIPTPLDTEASLKKSVARSSSMPQRALYVNKFFDGDKKEGNSTLNNAGQKISRSRTESRIPKLSTSKESLLEEIVSADQKCKLSIHSRGTNNSEQGISNAQICSKDKSNRANATVSSSISKNVHSFSNGDSCTQNNTPLSNSSDEVLGNFGENMNVGMCEIVRGVESDSTKHDLSEFSKDCDSRLTEDNYSEGINTLKDTSLSFPPDLISSHFEQLETTVTDSSSESYEPDSLMFVHENVECTSSRQIEESLEMPNDPSERTSDFSVPDDAKLSHPGPCTQTPQTFPFSSSRLSSGSLFSRSFKTYAPCERNRNRSSPKNVPSVELVDFDVDDTFCDVSKIPRAEPDGCEDANLNCNTNQNTPSLQLSNPTGSRDENTLLEDTEEISHDLQVKLQKIRKTLVQNQLTLEDFASESLRLKFYSLEKLASSLMLATLEHREHQVVNDEEDFSENEDITIEAVNEALLRARNKCPKSVKFESTENSSQVPSSYEGSHFGKESIRTIKLQPSDEPEKIIERLVSRQESGSSPIDEGAAGERIGRTNHHPEGELPYGSPSTSVNNVLISSRNTTDDSETSNCFRHKYSDVKQKITSVVSDRESHVMSKQTRPVSKNRTVLHSTSNADVSKIALLIGKSSNDKGNLTHAHPVNPNSKRYQTQQIPEIKLKQVSSNEKMNHGRRANTSGAANIPGRGEQHSSSANRSHSLNGHSSDMTCSSVKPSSHNSAKKIPASSGALCYSSESFCGTWKTQPEEPKALKVPITEKLISSIGRKTGKLKKGNIGVEPDCNIVVSAHSNFREALIM